MEDKAEPVEAVNIIQENNKRKKDDSKSEQKKNKKVRDEKVTKFYECLKTKNLQECVSLFLEIAPGRTANDVHLQQLYQAAHQLACGGDHWESYARGVAPPQEIGGASSPADFSEAAEALAASMSQLGAPLPANLNLARLECMRGNFDAVHDIVGRLLAQAEAEQSNRPRLFYPALVACCLGRDATRARELGRKMQDLDLDLGEYEYALLLEAATRGGGSDSDVEELLRRMQADLTHLSAETVSILEEFFRDGLPPSSSGAAGAGAGEADSVLNLRTSEETNAAAEGQGAAKEEEGEGLRSPSPSPGRGEARRRWCVSRAAVDADGFAEDSGASLKVVDLEGEDWDSFAASVRTLAMRGAKEASCFESFLAWLQEHGPFEVVVDGANVAFYGASGRFCWDQLIAVYRAVEAAHLDKKVLLVLHKGRTTNDEARGAATQRFLADLRKRGRLYTAPFGTNDDWFWLGASVAARSTGLLISNDECRDHIFSLLRPKYFLKWIDRHVVRYTKPDPVLVPAPVPDSVPVLAPSAPAPTPTEADEYLAFPVPTLLASPPSVPEEAMDEVAVSCAPPAAAIEASSAATSASTSTSAHSGGACSSSVAPNASLTASPLEMQYPPRFSTCVQRLPETGAWMIPCRDGWWLCARPESSSSSPV